MLARTQRRDRQVEMRRHGRGDDHCIDLRIVDELIGLITRLHARIKLLQRLESLVAQVAHARHGRTLRRHEVAHEVRAPVAVANDTDFDHLVRLRTSPMMRAGTPATIAKSGTSFVTTAPAPTRAFSPMVMPAMIVALLPMLARRLTFVFITCQSASVCNVPS